MTLAVPGATGFVALAQRAVIDMCARRPGLPHLGPGYTNDILALALGRTVYDLELRA
jgi:hypothetical protein